MQRCASPSDSHAIPRCSGANRPDGPSFKAGSSLSSVPSGRRDPGGAVQRGTAARRRGAVPRRGPGLAPHCGDARRGLVCDGAGFPGRGLAAGGLRRHDPRHAGAARRPLWRSSAILLPPIPLVRSPTGATRPLRVRSAAAAEPSRFARDRELASRPPRAPAPRRATSGRDRARPARRLAEALRARRREPRARSKTTARRATRSCRARDGGRDNEHLIGQWSRSEQRGVRDQHRRRARAPPSPSTTRRAHRS